MIVSDLPQEVWHTSHTCAIDTETTGLDFRQGAKPVWFQYYSKEFGFYVINIYEGIPPNLKALLGNPAYKKIGHYIKFDASHILYHHGLLIQNMACTKVQAKILDPYKKLTSQQSLINLVFKHLDILLDKSEQLSNWNVAGEELSSEQVAYMQNDVIHLIPLYEKQLSLMSEEQKAKLEAAERLLPLVVVQNSAKYDLTEVFNR